MFLGCLNFNLLGNIVNVNLLSCVTDWNSSNYYKFYIPKLLYCVEDIQLCWDYYEL